jgi:linker between RRM2 and RRM3 domains in RBM39 protein
MKKAEAPAVAQVVVASVARLNPLMKEVGDFPPCFIQVFADFQFLGGNLNAVSRQALMQKLARTEQPTLKLPEMYVL